MSQNKACNKLALKNETLENEPNTDPKHVKLNEKVRKYEEIIDKKNKEITLLQLEQENYKKKFSNYSEHNSSIAIRNACLERTLKEMAIEKLRVEKENMKLKENIACLEGQLSEQRLTMKEFLSQRTGNSIEQHPTTDPLDMKPPITSNCVNNKAEKPFQLKITKYLKKANNVDHQIGNRTPPREIPQPSTQQNIHHQIVTSPKSPERSSTSRKKQPYFGRCKLTPIKKDRIALNIQQAIIVENTMLDEDEEILF